MKSKKVYVSANTELKNWLTPKLQVQGYVVQKEIRSNTDLILECRNNKKEYNEDEEKKILEYRIPRKALEKEAAKVLDTNAEITWFCNDLDTLKSVKTKGVIVPEDIGYESAESIKAKLIEQNMCAVPVILEGVEIVLIPNKITESNIDIIKDILGYAGKQSVCLITELDFLQAVPTETKLIENKSKQEDKTENKSKQEDKTEIKTKVEVKEKPTSQPEKKQKPELEELKVFQQKKKAKEDLRKRCENNFKACENNYPNSYVVLDTEFVQDDIYNIGNNVIEVGAIFVEDNKKVKEVSFLVKQPNVDFKSIKKYKHLATKTIEQAITPEQLATDFIPLLKDKIIVGHGIKQDLVNISLSTNVDFSNEYVDTCILANNQLGEKDYSLESLSTKYGPSKANHRALQDAKANYSFYSFLRGVSVVGVRTRRNKEVQRV